MLLASRATSVALIVATPSGGSADKETGLRHDPDEVLDGQVVGPPRRSGQESRRLDVGWQESRYVSPLPSPDDLERYSAMLSDAPERLLAAGEREQAHRHEIESRLAHLDEVAMPKFYEGQRRGHYISLALGTGYEAIMFAAVLSGYAWEGIAGAAVGLGAMIWAVRRDTDSGMEGKAEQPTDDVPSSSAPADRAR
ncbi:MAG: DUF2335 domain-containing protein [Solirubrobacteraceae bacterium]|nr:DUF2335 domain-containing protein [Solirubrobacteraceae bacterium]